MVWETPALAARLLSTPGRGPGFCPTTSDVQTAIPIRPRLKQRATDTTTRLPDGSTVDGMPVSWTVLMHVVAVEGYTVQEQAWGETTWHAPEDHGDDWALLWQRNEHRWLPRTTFDGLVTAAYWSFAAMTVDSSRDRWAYGTPGGLGIIPVAPTVTFDGQTIYWYDPDNTLASEPPMPPAHNDHGRRDNAESVELIEAGAPLPGFSLPRTVREVLEDERRQRGIRRVALRNAIGRMGDAP